MNSFIIGMNKCLILITATRHGVIRWTINGFHETEIQIIKLS